MPTAPPPDLVHEVTQACRDLGVLTSSSRILVGVSAGADSTALACLLAAASRDLETQIELIYVDHGWRGAEDREADIAAVRALGSRLGAPTHISEPPPEGTPQTEDAARRWRYRCFASLAVACGCSLVATGHHAGDQAETLLMRLLRGSGMLGLAGIPPVRGLEPGGLQVIRPLLALDPARLRRWLKERGIPWREDATNQDLSRDRSAMRARLAAHPARPHQSLARLAARLRRRLEWRQAKVERVLADHLHTYEHAAAVAIARNGLRGLTPDDLALALRMAGARVGAGRDGPWFTRRHLGRMQDLLDSEGALDLPQDLHFHVRGHRAWIVRRTLTERPPPALEVELVDRSHFDLGAFLGRAGPQEAALDAEVLGPSPRLRRLAKPDRFVPYGRKERHRVNIASWMSRRGLSHWVRRGQWVLEGRQGIAWVIGERVDAAHAVGDRTQSVACIRLVSGEPAVLEPRRAEV